MKWAQLNSIRKRAGHEHRSWRAIAMNASDFLNNGDEIASFTSIKLDYPILSFVMMKATYDGNFHLRTECTIFLKTFVGICQRENEEEMRAMLIATLSYFLFENERFVYEGVQKERGRVR